MRTSLGRVASLGLDGRTGLVALRRLDASTELTSGELVVIGRIVEQPLPAGCGRCATDAGAA